MEDLSGLAKDSMWVTSQAAGNMMSSNARAMTAPGSQPVDILNDRNNDVRQDPVIDLGAEMPTATDGKPQARTETWSMPGEPSWGKTTVPETVRKPATVIPSAERKS